jgi:hypothetical protein
MTVGHVHRLHTRDGSDRGLDIGACSQAAPSCTGTDRLQPCRVWLSHRRAAAFPSMASLILAPLNLTAYCICTPPMHPSWWYLCSGDGLDAHSSASTPIWVTGCSSLHEKISDEAVQAWKRMVQGWFGSRVQLALTDTSKTCNLLIS